MYKSLFFVLLVSIFANAKITRLSQFVVKDIHGEEFSFQKIEGKCILVITTASINNFADKNMQYLNQLKEDPELNDLQIVAFPSKLEETKSDEKLKAWFFEHWNAKYHVIEKTNISDSEFFKFLFKRSRRLAKHIFDKYVIEKDGKTIKSHSLGAGGYVPDGLSEDLLNCVKANISNLSFADENIDNSETMEQDSNETFELNSDEIIETPETIEDKSDEIIEEDSYENSEIIKEIAYKNMEKSEINEESINETINKSEITQEKNDKNMEKSENIEDKSDEIIEEDSDDENSENSETFEEFGYENFKLSDLFAKDINGEDFLFEKMKEKCVLIVNTASGLAELKTKNMEYLNKLTQRYPSLPIFAFPSNHLNNEPLDNKQLKEFFYKDFNAKYYVMQKINAKDSILFNFLRARSGAKNIFDFSKFLVLNDGKTVKWYDLLEGTHQKTGLEKELRKCTGGFRLKHLFN